MGEAEDASILVLEKLIAKIGSNPIGRFQG